MFRILRLSETLLTVLLRPSAWLPWSWALFLAHAAGSVAWFADAALRRRSPDRHRFLQGRWILAWTAMPQHFRARLARIGRRRGVLHRLVTDRTGVVVAAGDGAVLACLVVAGRRGHEDLPAAFADGLRQRILGLPLPGAYDCRIPAEPLALLRRLIASGAGFIGVDTVATASRPDRSVDLISAAALAMQSGLPAAAVAVRLTSPTHPVFLAGPARRIRPAVCVDAAVAALADRLATDLLRLDPDLAGSIGGR